MKFHEFVYPLSVESPVELPVLRTLIASFLIKKFCKSYRIVRFRHPGCGSEFYVDAIFDFK